MRVHAAALALLACAACMPGAPHAAAPSTPPTPTATATASPTATPTPTPTPTPTVKPQHAYTPPPAFPPVTMRTRQHGGGRGSFTWRARVPSLAGIERAARANAGLDAEVDRLVAEARAEASRERRAVTFEVTPQLTEVNDRYAVVELTASYYVDGAAHPGLDVVMYPVVRATGRRLTLGDVFRDDKAGLNALSRYARERLPVVLGREPRDEQITIGTTPAARNFEDVEPRAEGLRVTFAAYQVASFGEGFPVLDVPWRVLGGNVAIPLPAGDREPAYRDGRAPYDEERPLLALLRDGVRVQIAQVMLDDGRRWALAYVGGVRVAAVETRLPDHWEVAERGPTAGCGAPKPVRASLALDC